MIYDKPVLNVLRGEKTNHIPFWFMRQAGRYLPEYRALREKASGFLDMAYNPEQAAEITMQPIRRFGMDAAIIFSDILVVPHALGQPLDFVEGEGPKLDPVRTISDLEKLSFDDFEKTLTPVYEALKTVRAKLQKENYNKTALIGFCGAPWTVACYMVEGGGSRDFLNVKMMALKNPALFEKLIDLLVDASAQYLIRQLHAGAEVLQIFDSWAGALDARGFQKWSIAPTREIVRRVRAVHPHAPIIGFPRGAGENYHTYVHETGISAVSLDWSVDTQRAARTLQSVIPVQGNLDPACLLAGGDALKRAAERIIADLSGGPFLFNLGHGIHKDTPVSHVEVLVNIIRNHENEQEDSRYPLQSRRA